MKILQDAPGVARGADGPLVTSEVVLIAPIPLRSTGTDANVQVRGVSPNVLTIRNNIKIVQGRMFQPGTRRTVVGKNANTTYSGLTVGNTINLGNRPWTDRRRFRRWWQRLRLRSLVRRALAQRGLQASRTLLSIRHCAPHFARRLAAIQGRGHLRPPPQRRRQSARSTTTPSNPRA